MTLDGKTLFSKHQLGRFPEEGEIVDILRDELSSHQGRFAKWMLFTTGLVAMGVLARWT